MTANTCAQATGAGRHRLLEVPSRMRPTPDLDDPWVLRKHVVIGRGCVHLEISTVVGQHLQWSISIARPGEVIHHLAPLTPIRPEVSRPNLWRSTRVLYIQGRVVALNPRRLAHLLPMHDVDDG